MTEEILPVPAPLLEADAMPELGGGACVTACGDRGTASGVSSPHTRNPLGGLTTAASASPPA